MRPFNKQTNKHAHTVVPLHSYKFAATLQHVAGRSAACRHDADDDDSNPLMIRVDTKAGHGAGKPTTKAIAEVADIYTFIALALGLQWGN